MVNLIGCSVAPASADECSSQSSISGVVNSSFCFVLCGHITLFVHFVFVRPSALSLVTQVASLNSCYTSLIQTSLAYFNEFINSGFTKHFRSIPNVAVICILAFSHRHADDYQLIPVLHTRTYEYMFLLENLSTIFENLLARYSDSYLTQSFLC